MNRDLRLVLGDSLCLLVGGQAANDYPLFGLIVAFLPRFTVMTELNFPLLPLLFIYSYTGGAGFKERYREGQSNGLALVIDSLQDRGLKLAVLEGAGFGQNIVRRFPGARPEGSVGERSVALTEARLMALLEIVFLDRY